ncbi:hypothetical protein [Streptomyces cyanogenus]|uniref:PH domain-containing protein n=1 Tax=Streptomyces cyanogenus TaxID=80860 RepID=A0ABX7TVQ6_STRCY|nr:hypothetical protein [Streptomyces cyanogenus]QTE00522.1 hypothetical protein S1361_24540 [Streptomyces cyanogenus]
MSTTHGRPLPLPLPASALPAALSATAPVPDGGPAWSGDHARRWLGALPPRWVPLPSGNGHLLTALCAAVTVAELFALPAGWEPWAAALLALHVLWLCVRPEIVPVSAPVLAVSLAVLRPGAGRPGTAAAAAVLAVVWGVAVLRLVARRRQRERAREAAGGVTAPLPDADRPLPRGRFLIVAGAVLLALGTGAVAVTPAEAAPAVPVLAWLVAGQGLTALASGLLGRRRAAALRAAPAPVLRVLVREGADGDTEVCAADDTAGLRPLFRVAVTEVRDGAEETDDEEREQELRARIDREGPGPLREAVLYGVPCDGAEILLVAAAEEAERPPVPERSSGPVRPLSEASVRRALAREKRRAAYAELRRSAGESVVRSAEAAGTAPAGVRQWRAGLLDRLCALLLVAWAGMLLWSETGGWRYALGAVAGVVGALRLPHWLAWRVTADREGLWFNGLRGPRHVPWGEIRTVECKGTELTVDSRRASFTAWSVHAPRWPWLERRFRLVHPHERVGGEITALWRTPSLRPSVSADPGQRGRPLWPLALALELAWAAALVLLP